jgi:hypothetical protein
MKFLTKPEVLKLPIGSIIREYVPICWRSEWMVFTGRCGDLDDFFYEDVGPDFVSGGFDKLSDVETLRFSDWRSREGLYDSDSTYVLLEPVDVEAFVARLRRLPQYEMPAIVEVPRADDGPKAMRI